MVHHVVGAVVCGDSDACTVVCVACVYAAKMLGCEGDGNAGVGSGRGVAAVSVYICGSGFLSSAGDVLEMSVVRGVCGVCDMCKCLAQGRVGGVGGDRTGFGLYQFWSNMGKSDMCLCFCCGGVGREGVGALGEGLGLGGWC